MTRPAVLVVGGASFDILHLHQRTIHAAGGAGLYTALAARRAGVPVTMFAPRPIPMPDELIPVARRLNWVGPAVAPDEIPRFEIAHYGGGQSELLDAQWGAEGLLTLDRLPANLPANLSIVHCVPLEDTQQQLDLIRHFNALGYRTSAGTYYRGIAGASKPVHQVLAEADIFCCNREEAIALFGSIEAAHTMPGKLLFVTLSGDGAQIVQGDHQTFIPAAPAEEYDPTGAGDTFCGTVLAGLALNQHPVMAARRATVAAAETITAAGPAALLGDAPSAGLPLDLRVRVDGEQVEKIAGLIAELPEVAAFDFTGAEFPPVGHPATLDFFFTSVLQQFGFWSLEGERYHQPLIAPIIGQPRKGSDYLWAVYRRWLDDDPTGLTPAAHARLSEADLAARYQSDTGDNPMPAFDLHVQQAQAYGSDMQALGWTAVQLVAQANASLYPVRALLEQLDHVGGYKEDPLRKKATLLAIILQQRPEQFLRFEPSEAIPPIIDYHLQRSCLRAGLVRVDDGGLRDDLLARQVLPTGDEWAIRWACYLAVERLQQASGRSMGAVDWFLFQARRRCPEMSEPVCEVCALDAVCAHDKALFQPVFRTGFY